MICFIFLLVACFSVAEFRAGPAVHALDGVQGILYEIPEYEDPDMAMFELSALGAMPVLTVLHMANKEEDLTKEKETANNKKVGDLKNALDDAIVHLHMARSKLENDDLLVLKDILKSVQNLKKMENYLHSEHSEPSSDVHAVDFPIALPLSFISDGEDTDSNKTEEATSTSTQAPTTSTQSSDIQTPQDEEEFKDKSHDSIVISETSKDEEKNKDKFDDSIVISETSKNEEKIKNKYGDSIVISETSKYEDAKKATFRKKWTWKSSSIV